MVRFLLRAHTHIHICTPTPYFLFITLCAHLTRNMEAHSYQSFTGVKLLIICYSDACLSQNNSLKYALTTQQPDVKPHDALVHECGHSEGTPGRQRVKTINILPPKTFEQVRAYPYDSSWLTTGFVPVT